MDENDGLVKLGCIMFATCLIVGLWAIANGLVAWATILAEGGL